MSRNLSHYMWRIARCVSSMRALLAAFALTAAFSLAAHAQDRVALVIGNDRYPNLPADKQLSKAANDSRSIGDALERIGFTVIRGENLDRQSMVDRIFAFTQKIKPGDTAVMFYAGHGVSISGGNYLLPSDVRLAGIGEEARVRNMAIGEADIIADIQERKAKVTVLLLDACRDNPFRQPGLTRSVGGDKGLTRGQEAEGVFAIYSAGFGQSALDSLGPEDKSPNSVFTRVLAPALGRPNVHLGDLMIDVREEVAQLAASVQHQQYPAYYDQTRGGRIYLAGRSPIGGRTIATEPTNTAPDPNAFARAKWAGWALTPQIGHLLPVTALAVSPDGRRIVSGSLDSNIKVWDAETGELLGSLDGAGPVISLTFSRDGRRIAAGGLDTTVRIWDFDSGSLIRTILTNRSPIVSVAFAPDGRRIAATSLNAIKIWDAETGTEVRSLEEHTGPTLAVAYSPDGRLLVSGSIDKTVKVWDAETFAPMQTLEGHTGPVVSVTFTPGGNRIISASFDKTVRIWDANRLEAVQTLGPHASAVVSLAVAPDGRSLLAGTFDGTIKAWDLQTARVTQTLKGHPGRAIEVGMMASSLLTGEFSGSISAAAAWVMAGGFPGTLALAYLPDGKRAISGGGDKSIKFWDVGTAQALRTINGHADAITSVAFSPDGRRLVAGSTDGTLKLWNVGRTQLERTLEGHGDAVTSVAFSPDGRRIASASFDNTVRLWSVESGKNEGVLEGHSDPVMSVAFSNDGRRIVTGSIDSTVRLWDATTLRVIRTFEGHRLPVMAVAFSPDGRRIASGSLDEIVELWDAATGKMLDELESFHEPVISLAFSPDGRRVVAGGIERGARLLPTDKSQQPVALESPPTGVPDLHTAFAVAFSRDGRRVAAAGDNRVINVWDSASRKVVQTLKDQAYVATSVAFSPDGRRIASGGFSDKTIRIWNAENGHLLVSLMPFGPADYLARAADGSFVASAGALENLHLTRGFESEPLAEDFKAAFMRERSLDEIAASVR